MNTSDSPKNIRELLVSHEGEVLYAYQDTKSFLTIGVGRLIDKRMGGHITHDEAMFLLDNDIAKCREAAETFPWYHSLDEVRQAAILDLLFNLGLTKFRKFARFISAMAGQNWLAAGEELADSAWWQQVGRRGPRIRSMIERGEWPK